MDTRKITIIAAVLALALIAIGIGYAYTASVSVDDNDVGVTYLTITPEKAATGESDAFTSNLDDFNIIYDTETELSGTVIKYKYALNTDDSTATKSYYKENASGELELVAVNNADKPAESTTIYYIGTQVIDLKMQDDAVAVPTHKFTIEKIGGTFGANYSFFVGYNAEANKVDNVIKPLGTEAASVKAVFEEMAGGASTATSPLKYVIDLYVEFPDTSTTDVPDKDVMKDVKFQYKAEVAVAHAYTYTYYAWDSDNDTYVAQPVKGTNAGFITLAAAHADVGEHGFVGWKVASSAPSPLTTMVKGEATGEGIYAAGSTVSLDNAVSYIIPVFEE